MTLNPQSPTLSSSKPPRSPRSRSYQPFNSTLKIQVVQLIDFDFKNCHLLQTKLSKSSCKYCLLKQKLTKPGEVAKCLTHLMDSEEKEELTFSPKTPPSKPKKRPYDDDGFSVEKKQEGSMVEKLKNMANQLCVALEEAQKLINLSDESQLVECLLKPLRYIPEDCKPNTLLTRSEQTSILNQNYESSIQFELSSFEDSYVKKQNDDTLKNMINYLLKQTKQSNYIRSEAITSFLQSLQISLKISQEKIREYENRIEQLYRSHKEKASTDHTIKELSDDFNFIDRLSQLGDMSLKEGRSVCLLCKNRIDGGNDDMEKIIGQGCTLESLIRNT